MKRKNRILYNNSLSINDWKEYLESYKDHLRDENEISETSIQNLDIYDSVFRDWVDDDLDWQYQDMIQTYEHEFSTKIIASADLGFWNGRKFGCKIIGYELKDCFIPERGCDYVTWELNAFNLISAQSHHDGTHYLTYRRLKDDKYQDLLERKAWQGKLTKRDISHYTVSIKHSINKIRLTDTFHQSNCIGGNKEEQ